MPCLLSLRDEFNVISPKRDKGADGTIGDSSHTSTSDHTPDEDSRVLADHDADDKNEVHALDIDSSGPWPAGRSFASIVQDVIAGERAKWLDAKDMCRLNYVIFDRKIYDKDDDFKPRAYAGSDPHTNHAHFSARYETRAENDTRPWGVTQEDDVSWTDDVITNPAWRADSKTNPTVQAKFALYDAWEQAHAAGVKVDKVAASVDKLAATVNASFSLLNQRLAQYAALVGDEVDEAAISAEVAKSVLAVLSPQAIAAALPAKLAQQVVDEIGNRFDGNEVQGT